mmetsp:Transcript_18752/g.37913  ORF Transcript_18752/g.37913 Transcript_18752/m.37913 type:complete len:85 (-) Transcript_18752:275-529(-)
MQGIIHCEKEETRDAKTNRVAHSLREQSIFASSSFDGYLCLLKIGSLISPLPSRSFEFFCFSRFLPYMNYSNNQEREREQRQAS